MKRKGPRKIPAGQLILSLCDAMRVGKARKIILTKLQTGQVEFRVSADRGQDVRDFYEAKVPLRKG